MSAKKPLEAHLENAMNRLGFRQITLHFVSHLAARKWSWRVECLPLHHRLSPLDDPDRPIHSFTVQNIEEIPLRLNEMVADSVTQRNQP